MILGLGRRAVLCNMLKLMRCNKWANPTKSRPLWQKHKASRRARGPFVWVRWRQGDTQWVSLGLWETLWTWAIVTDTCPGSSPWVHEVSLWEREGKCGTCTNNRWQCVQPVEAYRGTSGPNRACCGACIHTWMGTRSWGNYWGLFFRKLIFLKLVTQQDFPFWGKVYEVLE